MVSSCAARQKKRRVPGFLTETLFPFIGCSVTALSLPQVSSSEKKLPCRSAAFGGHRSDMYHFLKGRILPVDFIVLLRSQTAERAGIRLLPEEQPTGFCISHFLRRIFSFRVRIGPKSSADRTKVQFPCGNDGCIQSYMRTAMLFL